MTTEQLALLLTGLTRKLTHQGLLGTGRARQACLHLAAVAEAASELSDVIASMVRPLGAGGWLVLALHAGADMRIVTEWFGHEVDLDLVLHDPAEVVAIVERAGLRDVKWYHHGPLTGRGESTQRLYVIARKPLRPPSVLVLAASDILSTRYLTYTRLIPPDSDEYVTPRQRPTLQHVSARRERHPGSRAEIGVMYSRFGRLATW